MATARQRPTRRQLESLRAYIAVGSIAGAAHELGISETTVRQHLSGLYRRTGCLNAAQAAYVLGRAVERSGPRASWREIHSLLDHYWSREMRSSRIESGLNRVRDNLRTG